MNKPTDSTLDPHALSAMVDRAVQSRLIGGTPVNMGTTVELALLLDEAVAEIIKCSAEQQDATGALIQIAVVASHLRRMDVTGTVLGRH